MCIYIHMIRGVVKIGHGSRAYSVLPEDPPEHIEKVGADVRGDAARLRRPSKIPDTGVKKRKTINDGS